MSKLFFNNKATLVNDAIDGLVYSNRNNNLIRLNIAEHIRIVARNDWDKSKVAIISGGGAGHEPAHAGFVGKGMLTAAVCGDLFASPSVEAVLNAILHVTGDAGCLVIVKNYTGDRLNFGLAAEKAKKLGLKIEMVIVDDDIAIPDAKKPRGIAGTILVHKVAGHMAEQGGSLAEVVAAAQACNSRLHSLGVALTSCTLPGEETSDRIAQGKAELGLGIHGEPGISTIDVAECRSLIAMMANKLLTAVGPQPRLAVLLNNLGGTSPLEMSLLAKDLCESPLGEQAAYLLGPGSYVTAIDMKGFSISCLALTPELEAALQSPVEVDAWPQPVAKRQLDKQQVEKASVNVVYTPSASELAGDMVATVCQTLLDAESELNQLDALVGDGDTGSTFASGARKVQAAQQQAQLPLAEPGVLCEVIGEHLAVVMGGSSGVLLSIFFTAAGSHYAEHGQWVPALQHGLKQMKFFGGAKLGDRTMIDALEPALPAWATGGVAAAAQAAGEGAALTATMQKAQAGRSSYLSSDSLKGVPDPGAVAIARVFAAIAERLENRPGSSQD